MTKLTEPNYIRVSIKISGDVLPNCSSSGSLLASWKAIAFVVIAHLLYNSVF